MGLFKVLKRINQVNEDNQKLDVAEKTLEIAERYIFLASIQSTEFDRENFINESEKYISRAYQILREFNHDK